MKKFVSFSVVVAVIISMAILSSCKNDSLRVAKTSIAGPLGEYFAIVDRQYKVKDGNIRIEIERTAKGLPRPWKDGMKVGYSDGYVEPTFIIELMDKDGDVVSKSMSDIVFSSDDLETIVSLGVGESSTIKFSLSDYKEAVCFKVSSMFECHGVLQANNLVGTVAGVNVHMSLAQDGDDIRGRYYYDSQRKRGNMASLKVAGTINGANLELREFEGKNYTGQFNGRFTEEGYSGTFTRYRDGKEFSFNLVPQSGNPESFFSESELSFDVPEMPSEQNYYFSYDFDDSDDDVDSDWDDILDEYESLINRYISLVKKSKGGDLSALSDSISIMEDVESLSDKLSRASDDLSASQVLRMEKIQLKLASSVAGL